MQEQALSPLVKKVLQSGLVEKNMIELMERWKYLPEGAAALVNEDALKKATMKQIEKLDM